MNSATLEKTGKPLPVAWLWLLGLVLIVADQVSKYWCEQAMVEGQAIPVFPGFDLRLAYNTGVAFSFLADAGGWQRWFLSGVAIVLSLGLGYWLRKVPKTQYLLSIALTCILAGALGNLYDRVTLGYVIDFISVYYQDWRFAIFNIADSAVSVGAALLFIDALKNGDDKKQKPVEEAQ
jgi:signal peptidase II